MPTPPQPPAPIIPGTFLPGTSTPMAIDLTKVDLKEGDLLYAHLPHASPQDCDELGNTLTRWLSAHGYSKVLIMVGSWDLGLVTLPDHMQDQLADQLAERVAARILERQIGELKVGIT